MQQFQLFPPNTDQSLGPENIRGYELIVHDHNSLRSFQATIQTNYVPNFSVSTRMTYVSVSEVFWNCFLSHSQRLHQFFLTAIRVFTQYGLDLVKSCLFHRYFIVFDVKSLFLEYQNHLRLTEIIYEHSISKWRELGSYTNILNGK